MNSFYKQLVTRVALTGLMATTVLPIFTPVNAQNYTTNRLKCPDYQFSRTLSQGSRGEDVRLIQTILNLDYRTRVAPSGVGSKGYETDLYGVATREALKRFQALFIELIGSADGKFNNRTMTVMNSVCQGSYFRNGTGGVFDGVTTSTTTTSTNIDKAGPTISITAPSSNYTDSPFRLWIVSNEPIQAFSLDKFIISGGATISDLRKENSTTYKVLVTPAKLATHTVTVQLEAESVKDLSGNVNPNASNEITLSMIQRPTGPDITPPTATLSSGSLGVMTINTDGSIPSVNVNLSFSEPIVGNISLSSFVVRGSIAISDLKKLDDSNYSFVVNSSSTVRNTGSIQLPASVVTDSVGNKNTMSNEYQFNIIPLPTVSTTTDTTYTPPTYYSGSGSNSGDSSNMLMYLLMGSQALKGLTSLFGSNPFGSSAGGGTGAASGAGNSAGTGSTSVGGQDLGGIVSGANGACVCPGPALGKQTAYVQSTGPGPSGAYITMGLSVTGCIIGKYNPPLIPCGQKYVNNVCQGPNMDSLGRVVVGTVIPAVTKACNN